MILLEGVCSATITELLHTYCELSYLETQSLIHVWPQDLFLDTGISEIRELADRQSLAGLSCQSCR